MRAPWLLSALLAFGASTACLADERAIETVAGAGAPEDNGDAGLALGINIGHPFGVELGPDGALYVTEVSNHRVRRLDLQSGALTTVVGCGRRGNSGDGGPAIEAELDEPYEVRFDGDGNLYVVEMKNHVVRRVDATTNRISTVAGTGRRGYSGDGGPATEAMFSQPHSIALDEQGGLYIADIGNHRIRRVDLRTGVVDSIAGNSQRELPRDGQAARGGPILGPRALCIDGRTLWIALREGHSVWRMSLDDGRLHHVAGTGEVGYTGDGGPAVRATLNGPKGVAVGPRGTVLVVDSENDAIRMIDVERGTIATAVGKNAALDQPHGVCAGPEGAIYIGDTLNHRVLRVK